MKTLCAVGLVILAATLTVAQTEQIVNTWRDSTQRDPDIALDAAGNSVVVWVSKNQAAPGSENDIYLQRFAADGSPMGGETLVNTTISGDQDRPAVAMTPTGDFIVVWASVVEKDSMYDIVARWFAAGAPAGGEFIVNTVRAHAQTCPDVAVDASGQGVIVWESWFQDGSDRGVYMRRLDPSGGFLGPEVQMNVTTAYSQGRPVVETLAGGGCVTVWESWLQESPAPSGYGLIGRCWNPDGSPATGEFQINTTTADYQWQADVAVLSDSSIAVVWCSWEQDASDGAIMLRRFNAMGEPLEGEQQVNASTSQYQWLPRIAPRPGTGFVVAWSSWKQDGDREGVYLQTYTAGGRKESFETLVNEYAPSFQWEPAIVVLPDDRMQVVWSSWGKSGQDYEVVMRRLETRGPQGYIAPGLGRHPSGRSTTRLVVHVVDSTGLTAHTYRATFDTSAGGKSASMTIRDTVTSGVVVSSFPVALGEGVYYLTPAFDGVAVQVIPEFDLALDGARSYAVLPSGTNISFQVTPPSTGTRLLAPIDAALIWGQTDTLQDGRYATPLDTALDMAGQRTVAVPFRGWNLTDGAPMSFLVIETAKNARWDPREKIIFMTPPPYRKVFTNTHAEIVSTVTAQPVIMPAPGDTNYVLTMRPLLPEDVYEFTTLPGAVMGVSVPAGHPESFVLHQNYPNPFNPATTIRFRIPAHGWVRLAVYDLLGREVRLLVDELRGRGEYTETFDATGCASGVYVCRLQAAGTVQAKKMLVLK